MFPTLRIVDRLTPALEYAEKQRHLLGLQFERRLLLDFLGGKRMNCFSERFSTVCIRDLTRTTVVVSGDALLLPGGLAGVGEANTTARSLTVVVMG